MPPPGAIGIRPEQAIQFSRLILINLIYTIVIATISLYIYFKTKDAYKLTKHKGILYFRLSFLFLALMFLARFITRLLFEVNRTTSLNLPVHKGSFLLLTLTGLLSLISLLFSLLYNILNEKRRKELAPWAMITIAVLLSIIAIQSRLLPLLAATLVMVFAAIFCFKWLSTKKLNWFPTTGIIYLGFFIFWILNIYITILANQRLAPRVPIMLGSLALLLFIAYKVRKHFKVRKIKVQKIRIKKIQ